MSAKSKSSDRPKDRPFAPRILARARKLADSYQIVVVKEDGRWFGRGLELPNVFGDGSTSAKCIAATCEALVAAVATMLEASRTPPLPANRGMRSQQVNVRLTVEEKVRLETAAQQSGCRGLSDFIRTGALAAAGR